MSSNHTHTYTRRIRMRVHELKLYIICERIVSLLYLKIYASRANVDIRSFVRFISIFRWSIKVIRWNTFTKNFLFLCTQNFAHKLVGKPFHEVFLLWVLYDSTSNELTFCKANFTKSWWRLSLNLSVSDGFPKRIPEGMNQKLFGEMYKVLDK